ncbi:MAG: HAD domain-containing protein [Syntrophothermus sp.]
MNKVLFVDIDGVLNLKRKNEYLTSKNNNTEEFYFNNIYDLESMLNLRKIVLATNALIVSSSNRNCDSQCCEAFKHNLALFEIRRNYLNTVCVNNKDKNIEIYDFVRIYNIKKYMVLDDFTPQFTNTELIEHLYYINPEHGITNHDANNIIGVLNDE